MGERKERRGRKGGREGGGGRSRGREGEGDQEGEREGGRGREIKRERGREGHTHTYVLVSEQQSSPRLQRFPVVRLSLAEQDWPPKQ